MTRHPRHPLPAPRGRAATIVLALVALVAFGALWLARPALLRRLAAHPLPTALATAVGTMRVDAQRRRPNRLLHEKSPYLLQHAYNPVDWYPWGEEAFEKARRENRPIFLSIGYSTCHWCHVMERESFENDSVAALLNQYFVPIKVDREERPDVDRLYMTAMQAMGLGGGWPLNAFLTPDLRPFFGGTYFPPSATVGRPGLMQILPRVHEAWTEQRAQIEAAGERVFDALATLNAPDSAAAGASLERRALFDSCYAALARTYDAEQGGFGSAPKFPSIVNLDFLLRYWSRDPAERAHARDMALRQLDAMRAGGIHDHLGGGFHRYSTDREWLVPHFEKMLYDQAQIGWAFVEAYQVSGRPEYATTARDVFAYVARDMTSPEGAFYSAEDADSEGEEGRFYVWTPAQVEGLLGKDDAALFMHRYGVTPQGNFEHGTSILHEVHTLAETAKALGMSEADADARLARGRAVLLSARAKRVRPHRDDKVITAWNGLMISALARGARALEDPALAAAAARAAEFVWDHLRNPKTGALWRRWRDGEAAGAGQLDDYADYALGLVDLYGATFDPRWLERAVAVTEAEVERFWDPQEGGFFGNPAGDPSIKLRMKDDFDGAEIAGNSIAAYNLQQLAVLLDRAEWRDKAARLFDGYARRLGAHSAAMPRMLVAMDLEQSGARHIVIAGRPEAGDMRRMVHEFSRRYLPRDLLLVVSPGEAAKRLAALASFTAGLVARDGKATAYVCVNYACRLPTTDRVAFVTQLDERPAAHAAGGGAR